MVGLKMKIKEPIKACIIFFLPILIATVYVLLYGYPFSFTQISGIIFIISIQLLWGFLIQQFLTTLPSP
jgi:hypothetical protein